MESLDRVNAKVRERILGAAANLFSHAGYSGVSTREIASLAGVNEVTVYRHYSRKRDLFLAVLTEELGHVRLRGDRLKEVAEAADVREAVSRLFALIETAVLERPLMLPLVLYGALEAEADVNTLLSRHLGEFMEIAVRYLDRWIDGGGVFYKSARELVMALVAIAVFRQSLKRVFPPGTSANGAAVLAELCAGVAGLQTERRAEVKNKGSDEQIGLAR